MQGTNSEPTPTEHHRYRNYGDPVSVFDKGAESGLKQTAVDHYVKGKTDPGELWNGIPDDHSYAKSANNKVSDESYHFQQMF